MNTKRAIAFLLGVLSGFIIIWSAKADPLPPLEQEWIIGFTRSECLTYSPTKDYPFIRPAGAYDTATTDWRMTMYQEMKVTSNSDVPGFVLLRSFGDGVSAKWNIQNGVTLSSTVAAYHTYPLPVDLEPFETKTGKKRTNVPYWNQMQGLDGFQFQEDVVHFKCNPGTDEITSDIPYLLHYFASHVVWARFKMTFMDLH